MRTLCIRVDLDLAMDYAVLQSRDGQRVWIDCKILDHTDELYAFH